MQSLLLFRLLHSIISTSLVVKVQSLLLGNWSADWQIFKNCVILSLLRWKCFIHFSWNFPVSFGTGIFLFAPGLIDAAMLRIYQVLLTLPWYRFIFPCVPLASIDSSIGITFFKGLLFKNQFFYWFNVNVIWWQFYFCNC